jgi:chromosome segregation ATPase
MENQMPQNELSQSESVEAKNVHHATKEVTDPLSLLPSRTNTFQTTSSIDVAAVGAKLRLLCAGAQGADASSLSHKHDPHAASVDKGTLLATMLLEQAREGRINVDTVHLQALRISLETSSAGPDAATVRSMREEQLATQLVDAQRQVHEAVADLHRRELLWQIAEAQLKKDLFSSMTNCAAVKDALAASEARALELITDFAERDIRSARDAELQLLNVKHNCDMRIQLIQEESAAAGKASDEACSAAIAAVREECSIQLRSAKDSCRAHEQRSEALASEILSLKSSLADHQRTIAALRVELDSVSAALKAARNDHSSFISDAAKMKMEVREKEAMLQEMTDALNKMKGIVDQTVKEKNDAEKKADFAHQLAQDAASVALKEASFKMTGLEVRVQQLAHELQAALSDVTVSRASAVASRDELDAATVELQRLKDCSSEERSRFEAEIQHLKVHLQQTAAGRASAEDRCSVLNSEVSELQLKVENLCQQLKEQRSLSAASAEQAEQMHLQALAFIKDHHVQQMKALSEQLSQQKQLLLHTDQELRGQLQEKKQAYRASLAEANLQKKAADADITALRKEKSLLEEQVYILSLLQFSVHLMLSCHLHDHVLQLTAARAKHSALSLDFEESQQRIKVMLHSSRIAFCIPLNLFLILRN